MTAGRMRFAGGLAVLAAAAAAANWYAPTVFFDSQLMLGGSLAVLAVLHYGPAGLLVGLAALAVTVIRWQHPYELLIGSGFLFWLTVFLQRFNGGWEHRGNGRLLLAALGFWLLAGFWLETGIFMRAFGLPFREALGIGIKETFTGLANTTLGFLAFVSIAWWQARGGLETVSIRGLVCGLVLAAIAIPGIAITFVLSAQLKENLLDDQLKALRYAGERTAHAFEHGEPLPTAPGGLSPAVAVLVRRRDGSQTSTDMSAKHRAGPACLTWIFSFPPEAALGSRSTRSRIGSRGLPTANSPSPALRPARWSWPSPSPTSSAGSTPPFCPAPSGSCSGCS